MGNAPSNSGGSKKKKGGAGARRQVAWGWEFKDGRAQIKQRTTSAKARPLFRRQPSDNYDLWIFNPDRRSSSRRLG